MAAIQERNRLLQDLHDSVTRSLNSQTLYAEAVAQQLEARLAAPASEYLRQLRHTAQQALEELRLSALETVGFTAALQIQLGAVEGCTDKDRQSLRNTSIEFDNVDRRHVWNLRSSHHFKPSDHSGLHMPGHRAHNLVGSSLIRNSERGHVGFARLNIRFP